MDQHKVTKARELIDCGFYDDPEVLDALIDCCMEAITRDVNRSPAKQAHARIAPQFVARVKKSAPGKSLVTPCKNVKCVGV